MVGGYGNIGSHRLRKGIVLQGITKEYCLQYVVTVYWLRSYHYNDI